MNWLYFVALVGALVFVHELGHFAMARLFGVHILKLSIGLGPSLVSIRRRGTEYALGWLPLGGYVRMLGEHPTDLIPPEHRHRSLQAQALWKRWLIVLAGPMLNLLFPLVLYFFVYLGDAYLLPAYVGHVLDGYPAHGKLFAGDLVLAVDQDPISTYYELSRRIERHPGDVLRLSVLRHGRSQDVQVRPAPHYRRRPFRSPERVGRIGIRPEQPGTVIGVISPKSMAAQARLHTFDRMVTLGGQWTDHWQHVVDVLEKSRGASITTTVLRPAVSSHAGEGLLNFEVYDPRIATLTLLSGRATQANANDPPADAATAVGIETSELYIRDVEPNTPEARIGMMPGDRLISVDGEAVTSWHALTEKLQREGARTHAYLWRRGTALMSGSVMPTPVEQVDAYGLPVRSFQVGIRNWMPTVLPPPVPNPNRWLYAARRSVSSTVQAIEITYLAIVRLVERKLSFETIGGPWTMFEATQQAAQEGASTFLTLMAFVSVNLGLLNLLPIPWLDGGHLMFFFIEGVLRRPLRPRVRQYASYLGLAVLLGLMLIGIRNDIQRYGTSSPAQVAPR
jgi:regulator of sigma E protease